MVIENVDFFFKYEKCFHRFPFASCMQKDYYIVYCCLSERAKGRAHHTKVISK